MIGFANKLPAFCLILLIFGCASVGTNFRSENISDINFGTSKSSVIGLLGQPREKSVNMHKGTEFETFKYLYATASTVAYTRPKIRSLTIEFTNELVNGYNFMSNFSEDNTDFEIDRRAEIQIGKSTKQDVENVLGKPPGIARFPTRIGSECGIDKDIEKASELWKYTYAHSKKIKGGHALEHDIKILAIIFDKDGKVINMCHSTKVE